MSALILASTSVYRRQLLQKLKIPFVVEKPNFNEEKIKEEALVLQSSAVEIAEMLSRGKALSLMSEKVKQNQDVVVIAGDQLVSFQGEILGKAGDFNSAVDQLKRLSNHSHELITATTIMSKNETRHFNHISCLRMKNLTEDEIQRYVSIDKPYDCAGSYKIEESGIGLFSKIDCSDFTAIQGLPLLWVSHQLKEFGYEIFKEQS